MRHLLALALVVSSLGSAVESAEPGVKPAGAYPFLLPGLPASPGSRPKLLLWCHAVRLVGVVAAEETRDRPPGVAGSRSLPTALLLRDGRCEPDGRVSFGFLLPLRGWVFDSPTRDLEERTAWLLHRFEGSLQDGHLKGVLVQVDVNHPGHPFQRHPVEVDTLPDIQASFADEGEWRGSMARAFSLAESEP